MQEGVLVSSRGVGAAASIGLSRSTAASQFVFDWTAEEGLGPPCVCGSGTAQPAGPLWACWGGATAAGSPCLRLGAGGLAVGADGSAPSAPCPREDGLSRYGGR